jgi:hypothetical protein
VQQRATPFETHFASVPNNPCGCCGCGVIMICVIFVYCAQVQVVKNRFIFRTCISRARSLGTESVE